MHLMCLGGALIQRPGKIRERSKARRIRSFTESDRPSKSKAAKADAVKKAPNPKVLSPSQIDAAERQQAHLEGAFKRQVKEVDSYFGGLVWKWAQEGVRSASKAEKREFMSHHALEQFQGSFYDTATSWLTGSKANNAPAFNDTDPVSIVNLCLILSATDA